MGKPVKCAVLTFFCCFLCCSSGWSQYTLTGQLPASTRWSQINTPYFHLIFPADYAREAQRSAALLDEVYSKVPLSLGRKPSVPVPVLLNNQSVTANGITFRAPERIEMFTRPSQDKYPQDWMEQLILHEFRHVVQMDQLDAGFIKPAKWLFGEQAVGLAGILLPSWFLEGDATVMETAASHAGRGRNPSFWMDLKASLVTRDAPLSYDGIRYGSYQQYYPNEYTTGYWMVSSLRRQFGADVFRKILYETPRKVSLDPFSAGMKKFTGFSARKFYRSWMDSLQTDWRQENIRGLSDLTPVKKINIRRTEVYTSYRHPQWINDSILLAEKTGMDQVREFVSLGLDGSEEVIYCPGNITDGNIAFSNGILSWAQQIPDPRWGKRSSSGLRFLDLSSGKLRKGDAKTAFDSPAFSPDGKRIAVIASDSQHQYSLVLFSGDSVLRRFSFAVPYTVQFPSWSRDGHSLVCTVDGPEGRTLERIDAVTGERECLFGPSFLNLQHPVDQGEYILFTGDFGTVSDIYALKVQDRSLYRVTRSRFGASFPQISPSGDQLAYADYSDTGFDLVVTACNPSRWKPADLSAISSEETADFLSGQENFTIHQADTTGARYPITPYRKAGGFFYPHSWLPFYYDNLTELSLSDPEISAGAMLLSQSLLSDMVFTLGYAWKGGHGLHGKFSWMGLYPKIDLELDYGGESPVLWNGNIAAVIPDRTFFEAGIRAYIPLQFTGGRWQKNLIPYAEMTVNNIRVYQNGSSDPVSGLAYWSGGVNFSVYSLLSLRDIRPKWSASLKAKYMGSLMKEKILGDLWLGQLTMGVPGLFGHHSLQLSSGYQRQKTKDYYYETQMSFPRGYPKELAPEFWKLSLDYAFPLAYPDWSIAGMAYLKRIRTDLFYEAGGISFPDKIVASNLNLSSAGAEFFLDFHSLGLKYPFSLGWRPSYRFYDRQWAYELMFSADLSVF